MGYHSMLTVYRGACKWWSHFMCFRLWGGDSGCPSIFLWGIRVQPLREKSHSINNKCTNSLKVTWISMCVNVSWIEKLSVRKAEWGKLWKALWVLSTIEKSYRRSNRFTVCFAQGAVVCWQNSLLLLQFKCSLNQHCVPPSTELSPFWMRSASATMTTAVRCNT